MSSLIIPVSLATFVAADGAGGLPPRVARYRISLGCSRPALLRVQCDGPGDGDGDGAQRPPVPSKRGFGIISVFKRKERAAGGGRAGNKDLGQESVLVGRGKNVSEKAPGSPVQLNRVEALVDCGQQDAILTSLKEFTSRSGRRGFSRSCLVALAFYPIVGKIADAIAVETQSKPEKKKGRAPSSRFDEDRLLEQNRRMQRLNNAPTEFPGFVREGFQVKVITNEKYVTSRSGLIYYDMVVGQGDLPQDGQQVIFHYTGYNESGRRVDSSYQQGRPARTRLGIQGMIPGFEEGIKTMRAGGRRIIVVPPELGPPVGPSTFFSAKQFEVFDVELLEAKDCSRRTLLFYSDVVCD